MCCDLILSEPRTMCFLISKNGVKCRKKNYVVGGRKEHTSSPAGPQNPLLCTPLLPHLQHQEYKGTQISTGTRMENRNALRIKCHPQEWTRGLRRHWVRPPSPQRRAETARRRRPCDRRVSAGSAQAPRRCSSARTPWAGGLGPRPSRRGRTSRRDRRRVRRHQRGRRCSRTMGGKGGWAGSAMLGKACGGPARGRVDVATAPLEHEGQCFLRPSVLAR